MDQILVLRHWSQGILFWFKVHTGKFPSFQVKISSVDHISIVVRWNLKTWAAGHTAL